MLRQTVNKDDISQGFLLTNGNGGFCLQLNNSRSKYSGVFYNDNKNFDSFEVFKILEEIRLARDIEWTENDFFQARRNRHDVIETFFMPQGYDALVYELSRRRPVDILFDVKKAYDHREWGRNYTVQKEKDHILVTFTKKTDSREDATNGETEYTIYVVVRPASMDGCVLGDSWENYYYGFDDKRGSGPVSRHVYNPMTLNTYRIIITYSHDKKKALSDSAYIQRNIDRLKRKAQDHFRHRAEKRLIINSDIRAAYDASISALKSLKCVMHSGKQSFHGMYAGLPWFFQFWSRDELISINSYGMIGEKRFVVEKILAYCKALDAHGKIPNRIPSSALGSMDASGWLFKRAYDIRHRLSKKERNLVAETVEHAIYLIRKFYLKNGMLYSAKLETWMDTEYSGDNREGFRIEIQALLLSMYKLAYELTKNDEYKHLIEQTEEYVRKHFWEGLYLKDGSEDATIRPNVFIAAYVYPELLTKEEWKKCFQYVIPKLWCSWGGLSTISRESPLFCSNYTGENNRSYHRGDSWFFLNSMAAIAMIRVDRKAFYEYITRILEASATEITSKGILGYHAEISSASEMRSEGCLAQLWSSAMFVELIEEFFD